MSTNMCWSGPELDADGDVLAKYADGGSIPLTLVLDASGAVVYRNRNYRPGDELALERESAPLLSAGGIAASRRGGD